MAEWEGDWKGERPKSGRRSEAVVTDSPGTDKAAGAEGGAGRMPRKKQMGEDTSRLERITAFFFFFFNENIQTYTR